MNKKSTILVGSIVLLSIFVLCLSGCAKRKAPDSCDPLEPLNRVVYKVNKAVDHLTLKQAAKIYRPITPKFARKGIRNVFDTVSLIPTVGNDLLQGQLHQASKDTCRFFINATVGILGLFDVARHVALSQHQQNFGDTLMLWGYKDSMYFMLPFFGPSTVRDTIGRVVHYFMTPYNYLQSPCRYNVAGADLLQERETLLDKEKVLLTSAVDEYAVVRNSYLQYRDYVIEKKKFGDNEEGGGIEEDMLGEPPE